jgi:hypothetical protein
MEDGGKSCCSSEFPVISCKCFQGLLDAGFLQSAPAGFVTSNEGIFKLGPLPEGSYPITVSFNGAVFPASVKVVPEKTDLLKVMF